MRKLVIMPGGFHPFHSGHLALYNSAVRAFPDADVYVAATADTSSRPFPFDVKKKLAKLAGVPEDRFVQVKSPFRAEEITKKYNPADTALIFVRSEKDREKPPQAGGLKKDGSPSYLQPIGNQFEPMDQHGYMAYLPTVQFGSGMTSASEIRNSWPGLDNDEKKALVLSMYPIAQKNTQLADVVVRMLDKSIIGESVNPMTANTAGSGAGMKASYQARENQPPMENQGWAATYTSEDEQRIVPKGGLGSYTPEALERAVAEHMMDVIRFMKSGEYDKVDYMLYKWGVIESKIKALRDYYEQIKSHQGLDEDYIPEKWSQKYKRSIDCNNPRGFSQRAHCAGRKK